MVPPVNLRADRDASPDAELRVFAGAHAFLFGDRRAFAVAVDDFLARLALRAAATEPPSAGSVASAAIAAASSRRSRYSAACIREITSRWISAVPSNSS